MKSVLISIKPKDCELIANGEKTIVVKKTAPKLKTPFKCYIYCTEGKLLYENFPNGNESREIKLAAYKHVKQSHALNGKVIGEFVCDDIDKIAVFNNILYCVKNTQANKLSQICLTIDEVAKYLGKKNRGYNWHIAALKIYEKPKALGEFRHKCKELRYGECMWAGCGLNEPYFHTCAEEGYIPLTVVPQSWCYVEGLNEIK